MYYFEGLLLARDLSLWLTLDILEFRSCFSSLRVFLAGKDGSLSLYFSFDF